MNQKPTTILVVDDKEGTRYTVTRLLRREQYVVWEASTGEQALKLSADKPDLIILDINLPDINGYEVCRRIKADPSTAPIAVLHLSATFVGSENRPTGLEGGADGYLTYPVEPRELVAHVEALLRARRGAVGSRTGRIASRHALEHWRCGHRYRPRGEGDVSEQCRSGLDRLVKLGGRRLAHVPDLLDHQREDASCRSGSGRPCDQRRSIVGLANHTVLIGKDGTEHPIEDTCRTHPRRDG